MKVLKSKLTQLLVFLGVDPAENWDTATLASKVNQQPGGITRYKEENQVIEDAELLKLYTDIAADQAAGNLTEIEEDAAPAAAAPAPVTTPTQSTAPVAAAEKPAKAKPGPKPAKAKKETKPKAAKKPKASKNGKPTKWPNGATWAEQAAYWKKHPKQLSEKGPGVLRTVVDELKHAGKNPDKPKPMTKEDLLKVLTKQFSDRTGEKMMTYINNMVPTGLRNEYGIHVWKLKDKKDEPTGYFIVGDGKKPQPKAAKATAK